MKALILYAGYGTRLRPITNTMAKHLIPIANKPVLFYILEQIQAAGIVDVAIVVSHLTRSAFQQCLGNGAKWGINLSYVVQDRPAGIAHAVKTTHTFLGDSNFLLFLGDNLIQDGIVNIIGKFTSESPDALILLKKVSDPRSFGVAELNRWGDLHRLVEKPKNPKSNLALVEVYVFAPIIHEAIKQIEPSERGELEITDAIQWLIEHDHSVRTHTLKGWWIDTGKKEDILKANCVLLKSQQLHIHPCTKLDPSSLVVGSVEIGEGTLVQNSTLHGPVSIGQDCRIKDSYVGPHVSIGAKSEVDRSFVRESIIMERSRIINVNIENSLMGNNVAISSEKDFASRVVLFVGDNAKLEL